MADAQKFAQIQSTTLAGSGVAIGATTLILRSFNDIDGNPLLMTSFGSKGFGTLEPDSMDKEEQISFTGITQNVNGTATLTGVKNVGFLYPYTETSGVFKSHAGGVKFVISNTSGFYNELTSKSNDETITGVWEVPTPTIPTQIANKLYADSLTFAGAPDMSLTAKGIGEEADAAEINAGTQTGATTAQLIVNPKYLKDSIYFTQLPTANEKAAIAGNSGTAVSASNKLEDAADVDTAATASKIVRRIAGGQITLPATPSAATDAASKGYVDSHDIIFSAGSDIILASDDAQENTSSLSYVKLKEFTIGSKHTGVALNVTFILAGSGQPGSEWGRIYKNDVAFGTERTTAGTYTESITFSTGDKIQIYAKSSAVDHSAVISNFRILAKTDFATITA